MKSEYITKSPEETREVAKKVAQEMKNGGVVCLYGDLGSGKTTFTQGFAEALGIERSVNSPTFLVVRTYRLPDDKSNETIQSFYHIDLYRLNQESEMKDVGLEDIFVNPENLVVVEWSEKLGSLLPSKRLDIHFTYVDDNSRTITLTRHA